MKVIVFTNPLKQPVEDDFIFPHLLCILGPFPPIKKFNTKDNDLTMRGNGGAPGDQTNES